MHEVPETVARALIHHDRSRGIAYGDGDTSGSRMLSPAGGPRRGYGSTDRRTVKVLGLKHTMCREGRPRKTSPNPTHSPQ